MISHLGSGIQVVVGDGRHPMTADHRIAWIELICDGKRQRQFFDPGQWPVAFFEMTGRKISARAYCTLDGLWKAERRCKEASGLLWPELQACVAAM